MRRQITPAHRVLAADKTFFIAQLQFSLLTGHHTGAQYLGNRRLAARRLRLVLYFTRI
ncbi:MAG: hypothetical protein R3E67_08685 [Pseudomonadales bacterium]